MISNLAVIFDMDGVIVHSNPAHKEAIQLFCKRHKQNVSEEFLQNRLYGRTNKEWIPELMGSISPDILKKLANEKERQFRDLFAPKTNAVPGIYTFLKQLKKQDIPMAVATSAPVENANYILSALNIDSLFNIVLDSSHVDKGKPDPEIYIKASKALEKKPEECIVFEDSIAGIKSGLNAGCHVVGVTTTHTKKELEDCDLVIDNFDQIIDEPLPVLIDS